MDKRHFMGLWLALAFAACGPTELEIGNRLTYQVANPEAVDAVAGIVRNRLEEIDVPFRLRVNFDATFDVLLPEMEPAGLARVKAVVMSPGLLEFRIVAEEAEEAKERGRREERGSEYPGPPDGYEWLPQRTHDSSAPPAPDRLVAIPADPAETFRSRDLDPERVGVRPSGFGPSFVITFAFTDSRVPDFGAFTEKYVRRQLAIVIDGQIESAPVIQEKLPGGGQISGGGMQGFSREEAEDLVTLFRRLPLPAAVELVLEEKIEQVRR